MNQTDREILSQWLEKAEHDLIAAALIIESNPIILDIACFHSQQAVEKFLKAFLLFHDQEISKTHNLDILLRNCSVIDPDFLDVDVKDLEYFAVKARYPHQYIAPELDDAKSILSDRFRDKSTDI
jgi:HEPN domain-containing protein